MIIFFAVLIIFINVLCITGLVRENALFDRYTNYL